MAKNVDQARKKIASKLAKPGDGASAGDQKALEKYVADHGAQLQHEENPGLPSDMVRKAIERDGFKCVVCGTANNPLTVHHVRHMHSDGETLDGEGDKITSEADLNTVCTTCHDALHNLQRQRQQEEQGGGDGDGKDEPEGEQHGDDSKGDGGNE